MINNITLWLDKIADRFPDKTAFVDSAKSITFLQLKEKSICLAEKILEMNLIKKPIAVMMPKSVDVIIAIMAIAYSGNFYTIIDVEMPNTRKMKIFETLKPDLIIYTEGVNVDYACEKMSYNFKQSKAINSNIVIRNRENTCDSDLLYVLFTSGSTGNPKGVTITHQSVIDYIDWVGNTFKIDEYDSFGNQAPFYFDNSVLDIYTTIKTGATMYIIPQELYAQPVLLLEYLQKNRITTIFWVPSAMVVVANLHALKKVDLSKTLKKILFAGEVMPNKQLNIWRRYIPNALYANLYGPTETTVDCTYYIVDREFDDNEPLPIGKRTKNTEILVLNEYNSLVGTDEIGELCVRGTSLSKGYYNNIDKTREVFVQNPLNDKYMEYIYRTGDLVKYNELGELIYISRKDFQIKHLGHRIELGEIETLVSGLPEIEQCCCVYDNEKCKIKLFVIGAVANEEIFIYLRNNLPHYMIPNKIISVQEFPLTPNGKIDRKKLQGLV